MRFMNQVRQNMLAIISLVVATSALSYTTYRNELTEQNRNIRHAGFELLKELNQLQLLIDYAHYDKDAEHGNPITGWAHVLYIKDMSHLISNEMVSSAKKLNEIWSAEWSTVNNSRASNQRITQGLEVLRARVRYEIKVLD